MLEAQQGPADVAHLRKIILWSNLCFFVGAALMCVLPVSHVLRGRSPGSSHPPPAR